MTDLQPESNAVPAAVPAAGAPAAADDLWVERNGTRTYTGFSSRGARVDIGPVEAGAVFTPGELLKIALAACAGMSSDLKFQRVLGEDYKTTIRATTTKHDTEDRYDTFHEVFEIDLSALDEETRERVLTSAVRSIDKVCTVGNTLKAGAQIDAVEFVQPQSATPEA